jgi:ABC-type glycerol-3-phosphate transport system substrate-binding protein
MRQMRLLALAGILGLILAGCGGDGGSDESELSTEAEAACSGSELSDAPKLPASWPDMGEVTFTQQASQGPTEVVEGYFDGDIEAAHDDFKRELEAAGFTILFDEVEENDSEVSWEGEGRSGQVAIRNECGENDKMYVKVTNRPAS